MLSCFYRDIFCLFLFFAVVFLTIGCGREEVREGSRVIESENEKPDVSDGELKNESNSESKNASVAKSNDMSEHEAAYTVCREELLPNELLQMIEERKTEIFQFSYEDSAWLYLAAGYGKQVRDDFVAAVRLCREKQGRIEVDFILLNVELVDGRPSGEPSDCPCIVLRLKKSDKPVFFFH